MRETLVEVLGEERGGGMYTMDWLVQRVEFHLNPESCTDQVFLAQSVSGETLGHTIVRLDKDFEDQQIGLFSTTYVAPMYRGQGVAQALVDRGEEWIKGLGMSRAVTYTDPGNTPLLQSSRLMALRLAKSEGNSRCSRESCELL
jgi:GNAT superfamily N-acetyltransferase